MKKNHWGFDLEKVELVDPEKEAYIIPCFCKFMKYGSAAEY